MTPRITSRNARFQQWLVLLNNRTKRNRAGLMLVQGVRPINLARQHGWRIETLIQAADRPLSAWALGVIGELADAELVAMAPDLLGELAEKPEEPPELLAVVGIPPDDLARVPTPPDFVGVVFDRPGSPGNIGTVVRSADAFGASGVIVAGHAADPYDPKAVRASTGSLFALPVVRVPSPGAVVEWARAAGIHLVGTDETGERDIAEHDLTGPVLFVIGNETTGMSAAWRAACDEIVRIPIGGSASSLNAGAAATVALYETTRQRKK